MAFVTADRVRDTSTTAGSGSFSVSGTAPSGYRTFSAVLSVSDTFYYSIQHQTLNEWEVGLGTYSSANTFARTTIYSSSNAGSAVTFSAGTKDVFITMAAARSPQLDASGNVTALGTPVSATLTNATGLPLTTGVSGILPSANGGALAWQPVQTSSFTAVAGNAYPVNTTSGAVTVTLPASPAAGQVVQITDYAGTFATNNCTVARNGSNIGGASSNVIFYISRESIALVYIDATQGWIPYSGITTNPIGYSASYLIVAGGGGGGSGRGGGGGGGGVLTGSAVLIPLTTYSITVGGGGAANTTGSNSTGLGLTANGGGRGGGEAGYGVSLNGANGGSGGGGAADTGTGGTGTTGQGFAGGSALIGLPNYLAGGGGGASAAGANATSGAGGNGGAGVSSSVSGSTLTYAGGGGGSGNSGTPGTGGAGGGGSGTVTGGATGGAGTANLGGGGGGGSGTASRGTGGAGGSGVVILSIPTANYTGTTTGSPTVTTSGSNTILKFTASGSYTA